MDDLREEFIAETRETLEILAGQLVQWEKDPSDKSLIDSAFRFVHTVKGSCGFLDLPRLLRLSHAAEELLSNARDEQIVVSSDMVTAVLAVIDRISELTEALESGEPVFDNDATLIDAMLAFLPDKGTPAIPAAAIRQLHQDEPGEAIDEAASASKTRTVRVSLTLLDKLMNGISDLVLARNEVSRQLRRVGSDNEIDQAFGRLSSTVAEMRDAIGMMRMQHIDRLFSTLPRLLRDICIELGKQIELTVEGSEVEVDREMVEALRDPLTHILRNAADHGIEDPEQRRSVGKDPVGHIRVVARQSGNQILIEISDDGRGIDVEKLGQRAIARKLLTSSQWQNMPERAKLETIFAPGLSTAEAVTSISGRGVGMDVVKTNLEKLGCSVEVSSRPGRGTVVSISIPLTQAMVNSSVISGLIVGIDRFTLAIPQLAVNEIVRVPPGERAARIETVQGHEVFKLRDKVVPLVHLEDVLGITRGPAPAAAAARGQPGEIFIVLHSKQNWFGILVDRIVGTEEIVVRRPPEILKGRHVFAGSTILGNGTVSLILDIGGTVEAARLDFADRSRSFTAHLRRSAVREVEQRVVVFTNAEGEFFAIPVNLLSDVDRCTTEEIRPVGSREFIQRHGLSVPLLRLEKHLDVRPLDPRQKSFVILTPSRVAYPTAIAAGRIVETIVLGDDLNTREADDRGIMGTFFEKGRLINLLDIYALLQRSNPQRYTVETRPATRECRLLLAEDQVFFRQLVSRYFLSHGVKKVVAVENGRLAFDELSRNPSAYDAVISDIEMPVLNGYQLVAMIKSDPRLARLPVMALTALDGEDNLQKGLEAGFDAYEVKLDKEKVIQCLDRLLAAGPGRG